MVNRITQVVLLLSILALTSSCSDERTMNKAKEHEQASMIDAQATACVSDKDTGYVTATVTKIELEGGFYGLLGEGNEKYLPLNLAKEHQVDGTKLTFSYSLVTDQQSIYQWGELIKLNDICAVEASNKKPSGASSEV